MRFSNCRGSTTPSAGDGMQRAKRSSNPYDDARLLSPPRGSRGSLAGSEPALIRTVAKARPTVQRVPFAPAPFFSSKVRFYIKITLISPP